MKPWQFLISLGCSAACLVMVILLLLKIQSNGNLQKAMQVQQEAINKGSMSQQIGQNIIKDLAELSVEDTDIKNLLTKNGISVNVNPATTPTPDL